MKQSYRLLILLFLTQIVLSQTIIFADPDFKSFLVNEVYADLDNDGYVDSDVDSNNDVEIQVSEAQAVFLLEINSNATNISEISEFINLNEFSCINSNVINLDLSFLTQIGDIDISNNVSLESINLGQLNVATGNLYCLNNDNLQSINSKQYGNYRYNNNLLFIWATNTSNGR